VKPARKNRKKKAKVADRAIPIVDEVVEMVFARLAEAAAKAKRAGGKGILPRSSSVPEEHRGLAGAVADHLLAVLSRSPSSPRKSKAPGRKRAKRRSPVSR